MWMHPIFLLGLSGLVTGIVAAAMRSRGIAYASIACTLFCLLHGFAGYKTGMVDVEAALASVSPEMREAVIERGTQIAMVPLWFALGLGVPAGVASVVGWFMSHPTPPKK